MRDSYAQDLVKLTIESNAIDIFELVPILESENEVASLLAAHASDSKNRADVDDANAAHLHVKTSNVGRHADQLSALDRANFGDVIADQAIASFDQREHALTLADAAGSANQGADTLNIHHASIFLRGRRKIKFQGDRRSVDKFHGDHMSAKDGGLELRRHVEKRSRRRCVPRDHQTRKVT